MDILSKFSGFSKKPRNVCSEIPHPLKTNFPIGVANRSPDVPPVSQMIMDEQEKILIRGMLAIFSLRPDDVVWSERTADSCVLHFHPDLDPQLVEEAKEMADIAINHSLIRAFVTEFQKIEHSLTLQSLTNCITVILKKFLLHLVSITDKHQTLTLKLLQQHVAHQKVILLTLATLCKTITHEQLERASILSHLQTLAGNSGHSVVRELYEKCLHESMKPQSDMLRTWLKGEPVTDPHREFFIQPKPKFLLEDDAVSSKYEIIEENIPSFLQDISNEILTAGCYAQIVNNVQNELNEERTVCKSVEAHFPPDTNICVEEIRRIIQTVLDETSASLFEIIRTHGDLQEHLISLKEVFLFVRADVFRRFCDFSRSQIIIHSSLCSPMVLRNFMADAVSGSASTAFTQSHIGLNFHESSLLFRLAQSITRNGSTAEISHKSDKGLTFECISTDLRGGWVLQYLLTPDVREMYELIFGMRLQLFLGEIFCSDVIPHSRGTARVLLQRMLCFVQSISSYFSLFSVEQEWSLLKKKLKTIKTVESLSKLHKDYVTRIYRRCLLSNFEASTRLLNIATVIIQAAMCIDKIVNNDQTVIQAPVSKGADCSVDVERELGVMDLMVMPEGSLMEIVANFEKQFYTAVAKWLEVEDISVHEQLLRLLSMNECYVVRRDQ